MQISVHSQENEALSLEKWWLRLAISKSCHRARGQLVVADSATTRPPLPRSGNSATAWFTTAYSSPACLASGYWSFPYPPPGDVVGSPQPHVHTHRHTFT